jgi:hypothetical protein
MFIVVIVIVKLSYIDELSCYKLLTSLVLEHNIKWQAWNDLLKKQQTGACLPPRGGFLKRVQVTLKHDPFDAM